MAKRLKGYEMKNELLELIKVDMDNDYIRDVYFIKDSEFSPEDELIRIQITINDKKVVVACDKKYSAELKNLSSAIIKEIK